MGKQWDGGDIAFNPDTWRAVYRVLKPGAHLVAFGGTRTYHRMACAIEDAGFEIRDTILYLYGSGFPKSHDVSKGIDRAAGAEREVVGQYIAPDGNPRGIDRGIQGGRYAAGQSDYTPEKFVTAPASPAARQWEGWGTALKPAVELCVLARKPLSEGTVAANVLRWNVGALNIDGCRIYANTESNRSSGSYENRARCPIHGLSGLRETDASLAFSDQESEMASDLREAMPSGTDEGTKQSELDKRNVVRKQNRLSVIVDEQTTSFGFTTSTDTNSSRLFRAPDGDGSSFRATSQTGGKRASHQWQQDGQSVGESDVDRLDDARSRALQDRTENDGINGGKPKAPRGESKTPQCTCQKINARWPANVVHDGSEDVVEGFPEANHKTGGPSSCSIGGKGIYQGGKAVIPIGFEDSGSAARFFYTVKPDNGREGEPSAERRYTEEGATNFAALPGARRDAVPPNRLFYTAKADADDRLGSKHPTVKPLDLMQWLVRLVTPRNGLCLDPFAGTGTTGEAAFREGMRAVLIEREAEYQADVRRRMALVLAGPDERTREGIKARGSVNWDPGPLFR
jgi:DNA modification methylase